MSGDSVAQTGELRLDPESIEAIARRLAELLAPADSPPQRGQLISAEEVARWWGIGRRWVYDHADELGAHRLGSGQRPRLRFNPDVIAERLGAPAGRGSGPRDLRRSAAMRGDCPANSLSVRTGAMVGRQAKNGRGGAVTPPDPAPN